MRDFISEDDFGTFEKWLKYQSVDATGLTPDELATWRGHFDKAMETSAARSPVGLMKLRSVFGEYRYAVAVREGSDLWLVLWVRRSPKGEFFVMIPRRDRAWDPHTSYHLDGTLHTKSYGRKSALLRKCQPLTGKFCGTEHLGGYAGYAPKRVGAICDPRTFAGVIDVEPGVLGPRDGSIVVDLVEPGHEPIAWDKITQRVVFRHIVPWVVIRVGS